MKRRRILRKAKGARRNTATRRRLSSARNHSSPSVKRARSQAARKGWRTRRANERARSEAAKRGHETRKRNARSEAARKGHRTRRKREAALERRIQAAELAGEGEEYEYAITHDYKGKG